MSGPTSAQHEQPVARNEQSSVHKEPTSSQDVHVSAGVGNNPSVSGDLAIVSPSVADGDSSHVDSDLDRKSTRLNSSHPSRSRMPSSA